MNPYVKENVLKQLKNSADVYLLLSQQTANPVDETVEKIEYELRVAARKPKKDGSLFLHLQSNQNALLLGSYNITNDITSQTSLDLSIAKNTINGADLCKLNIFSDFFFISG